MTTEIIGTTVPWVALWSGEWKAYQESNKKEEEFYWSATAGIRVPGNLRAYGFHWRVYPSMPGVGEPLFAQVHTQRQFAAMRGPRCQVCGKRLASTNVPWVIPAGESKMTGADGDLMAQAPPTCEACQPVALKACPHLRQVPPLVLTAKSYRVVGVSGEYFFSAKKPPEKGTYLLGDGAAPWILARQLVVALEL